MTTPTDKRKRQPRNPRVAKAEPPPAPRDSLAEAAQRASLDTVALRSVRDWVAEQLVGDEFAKLDQGGHIETRVPLRSVFIDLPIMQQPGVVAPEGPRRELFLKRLLETEPQMVAQLCRNNELEEHELGVFDAPRALIVTEREQAATLLIGGPGQGKSTLGQLACQLHRAAILRVYANELPTNVRDVLRPFEQADNANSDVERLPLPAAPLFPLRIVLPDASSWLAKRSEELETSVLPALLHFLAEQASAKRARLSAETLLAISASMPFLLVLDGFDEVGAVEDRERIVYAARELLDNLGEKGAKAVVVATTRPQGYAGEFSRIGVPLVTRYLAELSLADARRYAQKLILSEIQGADAQADALERLDAAAGEPATARLLRTPLQVTIMAALVQQGRAPSERWKLFANYFDFVYRREIHRKTYASELLAKRQTHIQEIHARVGLLLQVEAEIAGGAAARMSRSRLEQIVDAVLKEDEIRDEERIELVREIVDAAERRLVFLVEPEPGHFGFEIRSFQEFMAAWALSEGRDAVVESRLIQAVKGPLFRNVVLFMASKLFSERSPLRDVLATRICDALEEDSSDPLGRMTKAGALLALEMLEEGSASSFPKRARALMERAVGLLELPAGPEHARLARVATDDTAPVLRVALEARLSQSNEDAKADTRGAWVCVVEGTNEGHQWAFAIGDLFWGGLRSHDGLLDDCNSSGVLLGPWIASKIEKNPELFSPRFILNANHSAEDDPGTKGWVGELAKGRRLANRKVAQFEHGLYGVNALLPNNNDVRFPALAAMPSPPLQWVAWVATATFCNAPSARLLADTLRIIADKQPNKEQWPDLTNLASWPLTTCLANAQTADDLLQFAARIDSGALGDIEDWRKAESTWLSQPPHIAEQNDGATETPWAVKSLSVAPPPGAFGFYDFRLHVNKRGHRIYAVAALPELAARFVATPHDERLLESIVSSALIRRDEPLPALEPELGRQLVDVLIATKYETIQARAYATVLRVWLGAVDPIEAPELLRNVFLFAREKRIIWQRLMTAIAKSTLSYSEREQLLLQCYAKVAPRSWQAPPTIKTMRTVLQSRRSGLASHAAWDRLELPLPHPLVPAIAARRTAIPNAPVVLRELHVQHIRGLSDLKLTFEPPPPNKGQRILLIGPNGVGKTTLLRCLAIALRNLRDPKIWPKGTFENPWHESESSGEAVITVKLAEHGEQVTRIRSNGSETFLQHPEHENPRMFPIFAYGCRRGSAVGGYLREVDLGDDDGPEIATLFAEGAALVHGETWLIAWEGDAPKDEGSKHIYDAVCAALVSLLDISSIEVRDRKVWVIEKGGLRLPLNALSDGYITTAGWFLDLVARWITIANRHRVPIDGTFLERMTGLVLLDEIDLHLHPSWQVEVIVRTREILPKMSFVATTHNPLTLVGADPKEIWILSREGRRVVGKQGIETPMLLTGGQIYSQYFGMKDIHPHALGRALRRYAFLSGYAMRDDHEQDEMEKLRVELRAKGIDPGWEEVPRESLEDDKPKAAPQKTTKKRRGSVA